MRQILTKEVRQVGIHDNHRERVRNHILNTGFGDMEPHQILEFILFAAIPRGDTNETAHRLINRFGSLNNVLEASAKELMTVEGIGPSSALHIASYLPVIKKYLLGTMGKRITFNRSDELRSYFEALCMGSKYETSYAVFTDKSKHLICSVRLSEGNLDSTGLYTEKLIEEAVINKAYYVAVAHNHPSGYTQPSPNDFVAARAIQEALRCVGKFMLDFVIVDHMNSLSFVQEGFLADNRLRNPYESAEINVIKTSAVYTEPENRSIHAYLNDDF